MLRLSFSQAQYSSHVLGLLQQWHNPNALAQSGPCTNVSPGRQSFSLLMVAAFYQLTFSSEKNTAGNYSLPQARQMRGPASSNVRSVEGAEAGAYRSRGKPPLSAQLSMRHAVLSWWSWFRREFSGEADSHGRNLDGLLSLCGEVVVPLVLLHLIPEFVHLFP